MNKLEQWRKDIDQQTMEAVIEDKHSTNLITGLGVKEHTDPPLPPDPIDPDSRNIKEVVSTDHSVQVTRNGVTVDLSVDVQSDLNITSSDNTVKVTQEGDDFDLSVPQLQFLSTDNTVSINKQGTKVDLKVEQQEVQQVTISSLDNTVEVTQQGDDFDLSVPQVVIPDVSITSIDNTVTVTQQGDDFDLSVPQVDNKVIKSSDNSIHVVEDSTSIDLNSNLTITSSNNTVEVTQEGYDYDLSVHQPVIKALVSPDDSITITETDTEIKLEATTQANTDIPKFHYPYNSRVEITNISNLDYNVNYRTLASINKEYYKYEYILEVVNEKGIMNTATGELETITRLLVWLEVPYVYIERELTTIELDKLKKDNRRLNIGSTNTQSIPDLTTKLLLVGRNSIHSSITSSDAIPYYISKNHLEGLSTITEIVPTKNRVLVTEYCFPYSRSSNNVLSLIVGYINDPTQLSTDIYSGVASQLSLNINYKSI